MQIGIGPVRTYGTSTIRPEWAICAETLPWLAIPAALPLVGAAEDEAFAVRGRLTAPDAGPLLRLAVCGDDARRGGSGGLDVVLALGRGAVEWPRPARRDGCHELVPSVPRDGPLIAELGRPPQQQVLEGGQLQAEPRRGGVQRD